MPLHLSSATSPSATPTSSPTVLVLASGRGERFTASGGATHKLHADLCGHTVLERTLDAVRASGLPWHLEDRGHPGMGDSIAAAVAATSDAAGWMILPADLPLVQCETLQLLAGWQLEADALVPTFEGQRGHPVRFSRACQADLLALRGEQGAAGVVRARTVTSLAVGDVGCITDIDTVDDLQRARALWAER
jgi:molybdenum cofactor cytidylyltransferase